MFGGKQNVIRTKLFHYKIIDTFVVVHSQKSLSVFYFLVQTLNHVLIFIVIEGMPDDLAGGIGKTDEKIR